MAFTQALRGVVMRSHRNQLDVTLISFLGKHEKFELC